MAEKEYIERGDYCKNICKCNYDKCDTAKCPIWIAPAADVVEVKHGEWSFVGSDRWNDCFQCSACGKMAMDDSNYCPNCGAKMDGRKGDRRNEFEQSNTDA